MAYSESPGKRTAYISKFLPQRMTSKSLKVTAAHMRIRRSLQSTLIFATLLSLVCPLQAAPTEGRHSQATWRSSSNIRAQFPQQPLSTSRTYQAYTKMQPTLYTYTLDTFFQTQMQLKQVPQTFFPTCFLY